MLNRYDISRLLPPAIGKTKRFEDDQDTDDIVELLLDEIDNDKNYKLIARNFERGNAIETARACFDFLKDNFVYRIESNSAQSIKSLPRFVADGYGDCKHYSVFIGAILHALDYPFRVRFVSYSENPDPTHVFVVLKNGKGEVWADAVNTFFNSRTPQPVWQKDYIFDKKKMALDYLSGIGAEYNTGIRPDLATMTTAQETGAKGGFWDTLGDIGGTLLNIFGGGLNQSGTCPPCQASFTTKPSSISIFLAGAAGIGLGYLIKKL